MEHNDCGRLVETFVVFGVVLGLLIYDIRNQQIIMVSYINVGLFSRQMCI